MTQRIQAAAACAISLSATLAIGANPPAGTAAAPQVTPPISLVVLDKHCANIVQSYKLSDNVAELLKKQIGKGVKGAIDFIRDKLDRGGAKGSKTKDSKAEEAEKDEIDDVPPEMRLEAKRMNWMPMQTEVMYGERAHAQETNILERESKLGKKHYPVADAMLAQILAKVEEEHEYQFQLFILKNSTRNAIARPGGFLYLDQGLIDNAKSHAKARFALAHEVGHVLQRHETRELQGMIVDSYNSKDEMQKAITNVKNDPGAVLANVKVGKEIYARHHSDQELQADSCSARLLSRVHTKPKELAKDLDAFIKDLPPMDGAAGASNAAAPVNAAAPGTAAAPVNPAAPAITAPVNPAAPATTASPAAPATAAPAPPAKTSKKGSKAAKEAEVATELAAAAHEIVASPAARHPNTAERVANLDAIYKELTTPAAAAP